MHTLDDRGLYLESFGHKPPDPDYTSRQEQIRGVVGNIETQATAALDIIARQVRQGQSSLALDGLESVRRSVHNLAQTFLSLSRADSENFLQAAALANELAELKVRVLELETAEELCRFQTRLSRSRLRELRRKRDEIVNKEIAYLKLGHQS